MANATTYEEWALAAAELDKKVGTAWRTSDSDVYDFRLITARTRDMVKARGDIAQVAYLLRSGLLRNLGGIIDKRLYDTLYRGTKKVIEDYVHEVLLHIDLIRDNNTVVSR